MGFMEYIRRKYHHFSQAKTLTEEEKEKESHSDLQGLMDSGYVNEKMQITIRGKSLIHFFMPRETQDNELKEILSRCSDEKSVSLCSYLHEFSGCLLDNNFVDLPFYSSILDHQESIDSLRVKKDLTQFQFQMLLGLYHLSLAERRKIIKIKDNFIVP